MATSSASSGGQGLPSTFAFSITEKLARNNHGLWMLQVMPAIRGARLEGYLDGSTPAPPKEVDAKEGDKIVKIANPEYATWVAHDQQLLSYLLSTMTRDVMAQVASAKTAAGLWTAVGDIFSSQIRARSVNIRIALATTRKANHQEGQPDLQRVPHQDEDVRRRHGGRWEASQR